MSSLVPSFSLSRLRGRRHCAAVHPARLRLDRTLSCDRRYRGQVAGELVHTLDGEAVVCGPDGVAVFDALHRRGAVSEAMLYAFDVLELDGQDLRALPLVDRKRHLARLLGRRRIGIVLSDHTDGDGATIFRHACRMGLEGIVSKRLSAPYRSGPSRDWLKVNKHEKRSGRNRLMSASTVEPAWHYRRKRSLPRLL
jgi:ATP dependent DNA ligase domain